MSSRISINPFFTPTQISGCQLWLDAADSTTFSLINNSIITQWRDKSGNGRIATPGGSPVLRQKSINGLSSIYYDGNTTGAFTGSISITTSSIYAFVVFVSNMNAGSEGMRLISFSGSGTADWNSSSTGIMFLYDTNRIQTWRNSSTTTNLTCPTQGSTILSTTYYNGSIAYNSLFGGTSSSAIGSSGSFNITTFNMTFGNVNMKGNLAEIIIYNSVLTTAQVQQVEGYLAWKWGIQGSLPTNNPYKLSFLPSLLNPPVTVPTGTAITSYVGWSPLNVPRCGLWLDAADTSSLTFTAVSATFNQYVTLSDTVVPYTGTLTSLTQLSGGTSVMNGGWIGVDMAATLIPSATTGQWYSFFNDPVNCKVVKLQFTLTGTTLYVKALNAGYNTVANALSSSNTPATNDSKYSSYTLVDVATSATVPSYGVASFSMNISNGESSSNVSVWTDKSAGIPAQFLTNAMATARAGTSPNGDIGKLGSTNYPVSGYNINGVNCLYFNQAILQAITTQSTTTRTYFAVVRFPSPFTSGALLWPATWSSIYAFGGSIQVNSTGVIFASQNVANLLALNYSTDTPFIISITFNNGTTNMWNTGGGTTIPTGQTSATLGSSDNYLWIGGVSGYYMSPYLMGEFLEYNSALSTSQRQQVEGYLAWKWGLSGSLPATHPYKSFPPSTRSTIVPVSVAKTATWQPTQISGCQLWLDATDASTITLNGTTVTFWRDKRGNYTMTSVAGTPTYTKSSILSSQYVVRFNGTNDSILYNGFTLAQPFTVFAVTVQRGSTPSGYSQVIGSSSGISAVILYTNIVPTTLTFYAGNNVVLSPNIQYSFNIPGVYSSVFNGTSSFLGFNGTGQSNLNPGTLGWSGIYLGRDFNNTFTSQDVGEIIYYNFALNTAQRQQTEGYLAWKWGLQGSLPSNHPFKLWPPPP